MDPFTNTNFTEISKQLPMQARMAVLKTWGNSWATSERYHEETILPCIFGCGGMDNTAHYLQCDILWTLINGCTSPQTHRILQNCPPDRRASIRACLISVNPLTIMQCLVAFKTYHALRMDYRRIIDEAIFTGKYEEIWGTACDLVLYFKQEFVQHF